jgi:hypothetical protein
MPGMTKWGRKFEQKPNAKAPWSIAVLVRSLFLNQFSVIHTIFFTVSSHCFRISQASFHFFPQEETRERSDSSVSSNQEEEDLDTGAYGAWGTRYICVYMYAHGVLRGHREHCADLRCSIHHVFMFALLAHREYTDER